MKKFDFEWQATDGLLLKGSATLPDAQLKGAICLVHGFAEYFGRYAWLSDFFAEKGYGVLGFDLRGHGHSGGKRGYTPSYGQLMSDISQFIALTAEKLPGVPLFLYGHSMGGNLVLNYMMTQKTDKIQAAISTSPLLRLPVPPPAIKLFMGKIMNKVMPSYAEKADLDVAELSRDLEVGKAYAKDPLIHGMMSARLYNEVVEKAGPWAIENAQLLKKPTLLMHGESDTITCPKASKELAAKNEEYVSSKFWDGLRHEMHNETNKEEVLTYIWEWLERQGEEVVG